MSSNPIRFLSRVNTRRLPRVCVAVIADDPAAMMGKAEALVRENPFLELRLDYLKEPAQILPRLREFLAAYPEAVVVVTCRRVAGGGRFKGTIDSELQILGKAAALGCHMVDLELETATRLKTAQINKLKEKTAVILSYHDYKTTKKLRDHFSQMQSLPADFYKVVSTATSLRDNVEMMRFLEEQSQDHQMVGVCMGEQGIISRILAVRGGSIFTFASATVGEETAPGQVAARTLHDVYRIDQVDAATKVYGVLGDPVSQSLSPAIMNAAFRRESVNAVYLPLHAKNLDDFLACVRQIPIQGFSVTMPYKQAIVEHLDNSDVHTQKTGACNTVIRAQDGKLYGFNTDTTGVLRPLQHRMNVEGARVLVLGAGGAARAAVFALVERGAEVFICNRTPEKAQKLARQAGAKTAKRADLKKLQFDVIVNATPLGMGKNHESPLQPEEINARILFEMVYDPVETPLVQMARAKGLTIIPGSEMFVQQAARQFEIWTGKPAPVDEMQRVVTVALAERAATRAATPPEEKKSAPAKKLEKKTEKNDKSKKKVEKKISTVKAKPSKAKVAPSRKPAPTKKAKARSR